MKIDKIASVEKEMEKNFRNYWDDNGTYFEGDYDNFSLGQYGYQNATGANPAGMAARKVSRLNPNARILSITITNSTDGRLNVKLWTDTTTDSIPTGTSVTLAQGSYAGLLDEIFQKPFRIQGMKYAVTYATQFDNAITLGYADNFGSTYSNTLTPLAYRSNLQNIATQLDIEDFTFDVGVDSFMTIPVNGTNGGDGGESITFTFFVNAMVQPVRTFTNMPVEAKSPQNFITGLPKQEIQVTQKPLGQGRL